MPLHDLNVSLGQMLDHAREAMSLSAGKTRDEMLGDRILGLALVRLLEIVGESANRIPKEWQNSHPELPWAEMIALRNRLIHAYDTVDMVIVVETVLRDLPKLVDQLEPLIS